MSEVRNHPSARRGLIVVSKVIVTPRGSAVKATRLELSEEGTHGLESKSSGIKSAKDSKEKHVQGCSPAVA